MAEGVCNLIKGSTGTLGGACSDGLREAHKWCCGKNAKSVHGWDRLKRARNDLCRGPIAAEELLEEIPAPGIVWIKRCAGGENPQLQASRVQAEAVEKQTQEVCYLGAGSSTVEMEFIYDQVEHAAVLLKPLPRSFQRSAHQPRASS